MATKKEYIDVLNNLKNLYEKYSVSGDKLMSFIGRVDVLHLSTDPQDGEWEKIGLMNDNKNGKFVASYCHSSRSNMHPYNWGIDRTAEYINSISRDFDLNTGKLKNNFLKGIEAPIRRHLIEKAKIKQKLERHKAKIESLLA